MPLVCPWNYLLKYWIVFLWLKVQTVCTKHLKNWTNLKQPISVSIIFGWCSCIVNKMEQILQSIKPFLDSWYSQLVHTWLMVDSKVYTVAFGQCTFIGESQKVLDLSSIFALHPLAISTWALLRVSFRMIPVPFRPPIPSDTKNLTFAETVVLFFYHGNLFLISKQ